MLTSGIFTEPVDWSNIMSSVDRLLTGSSPEGRIAQRSPEGRIAQRSPELPGFLGSLHSFVSLPNDVIKIILTFASVQPCQGKLVHFQEITSPAPHRSSMIFKSFHKCKIIYIIAYDGFVNSGPKLELVIEDLGDIGNSTIFRSTTCFG